MVGWRALVPPPFLVPTLLPTPLWKRANLNEGFAYLIGDQPTTTEHGLYHTVPPRLQHAEL